ncbi:MAG: Na/Pi cotransporter family protein [Planctomycetes bacterium]|nr:Na/Pi cotransporter family protein [Planctomycetota bacterium]
MELIGKILIGLGLMLTGVLLLSNSLKQLGSRQFRMLATRFVSTRPRATLFGLCSGALMQSTSAALVILASLICAGLLSVAQAAAVLTGFSVGNCVLVFVVSLNLTVAVMFVVGLSGIGMYLARSERIKTFFGAGLGLGLIFFGIELMLDGVAPLRHKPWFAGAMAFSRDYSALAILAGAVLGFIAQSSTAVALVAIGLTHEEILKPQQAFLFMYGAAIGSTMFKVLLGSAFRGSSRQLVRFVNIFNCVGAALFIGLYYVEVYLNVPLVIALICAITADLDKQAAFAFLFFNVASAIIVTAVQAPLLRWLARSLPATEEESMARPKYLNEFEPQDPDTGLELVRLEQTRELEQISAFMSTARKNYAGPDLKVRHDAFKTLAREVSHAASALLAMPMEPATAHRHAFYQTRQALFAQLGDSAVAGVHAIEQARGFKSLEMLSEACLESVDFLLMYAVDGIRTDDEENRRMLLNLSSDQGPTMERLRKAYMDGDNLTTAQERGCLLDLTMLVEKIVWLIGRLMSLHLPADGGQDAQESGGPNANAMRRAK